MDDIKVKIYTHFHFYNTFFIYLPFQRIRVRLFALPLNHRPVHNKHAIRLYIAAEKETLT
jgi:hypothetical protein